MPDKPPTLADLAVIAARALDALDGDGTVNALWERALADGRSEDRLLVTVTAMHEGRAARAQTRDVNGSALQRTARAAALRARQARAWPAAPLPGPVAGRPHEGFAAALLDMDAASATAVARRTAGENLDVDWSAAAVRSAVASTTGVRAAEQRSHVVAHVRGERANGRAAGVTVAGVGDADVAGAAAEVRALLGEGPAAGPFTPHVGPGEPVALPDTLRSGAPAVVFGPEAVAVVLEQLRPAVGVDLALGGGLLAGRRGRRIAAPAVNLSDSARYPLTLPRSYDAEGVPRRPVALIQDGVAHGQVHDSASAARAGDGASSTGHATQAGTLAPFPDHLVLVGGGVDDVTALCAQGGVQLMIPRLSEGYEPANGGRRHRTGGAALVRDGHIGGALGPIVVEIDALAVLASVEALTSRQRLVGIRGHCPGGMGAAVVPALRAGAGVRIAA